MKKLFISFLFCLGLSFINVSKAEVFPIPTMNVVVEDFTCEVGRKKLYMGSQVRIDGSILTAAHVVRNCEKLSNAKYPVELDLTVFDVAILKNNGLTECRDAEPLEPIIFIGLPMYNDDGMLYSISKKKKMNFVSGTVKSFGNLFRMSKYEDPEQFFAYDMSFASSQKDLEPGYSGGAVISHVDGRLVGIISAKDQNGSYFSPISQICSYLVGE